MDGFHIAALLCVGLIVGGGRISVDMFKDWKVRRQSEPDFIRNAGFWTDNRVLWLERVAVWTFWTWAGITLAGSLFILAVALGDKFGLLPNAVG